MALETIESCPVCSETKFQTSLSCTDYTVSKEQFTVITCENCSFKITSPRPSNYSIASYYNSDNYISHAPISTSIADKIYFIARKFSLEKKRKILERFAKDGKLLDIGCGTGEFLKHMKHHGRNVTGTEPNPKAHSIAASNGIEVLNELIEISEDEFEAITLWHVLEHIHNLNEVLEKIKSLLSPTGTIFIAVPNHKSFDANYYNQYWAALDVPRHLWHFNQKTMKMILNKHHLRLIDTFPMKLDSFYVSLLSESYKHPKQPKLLNMIIAFATGLLSNIKAVNTSEYSSLIYVVRK